MARIHVASGTPGLLTDLGAPFLRNVYYRNVLSSPLGRAFVVTFDGKVAGFVTSSTDSGRLFPAIFRRNLAALAWSIVRATPRHPRLPLSFLETARSVAGSKAGSNIPAEVVSLEVDVPYQHHGLGYGLLATAVVDLQADRPQLPIKARILADHREVERLYEALGFHTAGQFRMHGRAWKMLVLETVA